MKIVFVQHKSFINGSGGTEKICTFLANHFVSQNHEVTVATNENMDGSPVFPMDDRVKITNIFDHSITQVNFHPYYNYKGKNPFMWIRYKLIKKRTKFLNKRLFQKYGGAEGIDEYNLEKKSAHWKKFFEIINPDIIITMSIESLLEITFKNKYTVPVINSTNGRPDYDYSDKLWYRSDRMMLLLKESYRHLSAIQILFDSYREFLPQTFTGRSVTIANPVVQTQSADLCSHEQKLRYTIINVASLVNDCKQQSVAIDLFSDLSEQHPDWDMEFWGTGPDMAFLEKRIHDLGMHNRIFLKGFTDRPLSKMKDADLFLFPSKYEGFGLALAEAMSVGLPCIGFKSCSGVNEIIIENENGFLAKDVQEMKKFMDTLMSDRKLRKKLGENAHRSIIRYDEKEVLKKWDGLVNSFTMTS